MPKADDRLSRRIPEIILAELRVAERRLLALTVAVRKQLGGQHHATGDLSATVRSCLRRLVATRQVLEADGVFTLPRR